MSTPPLPHDPLWPRAGGWPGPSPDAATPGPTADLALLGVGTWRTSLSATGAHATPAAVRDALRRYGPALVRGPGGDPVDLGALAVVDHGDVHEPDGPDGEARARDAVAAALAGARALVALGGDNALTVPVALGAWGETLATAGLVTFDAHHDLRDGVSNGSPVRRLVEAGLDPSRVVQVGIADFANSAAYVRRARDLGITVVTLDDVRRAGGRDGIGGLDDLVREALDVAGAAGGPVHLDVDVDVCDRSVAPGCPASVPGGLAAWELRALVRAAAQDERVRSVDVAEVDATADAPDGRTVRLAALCVLEVLAGVALRRDSEATPPR
ncbi:arginase family protein [Isoptericola sp. NEAU-Y5]|uniref:Arginase family protein n=1 Tax=Isoptericola luteus TaxID=2879484 RepID=A0ABS7Z9Q9_9MICO|nr:arginase family protein [Isoptericola sp. NEAU-Y5]MCA5891765.1 arginase family protein [Isoptericola sp. NEAU-Y5]MCA5894598.1 arginase family protein [Isoptericola sp. NEAU-Y5]